MEDMLKIRDKFTRRNIRCPVCGSMVGKQAYDEFLKDNEFNIKLMRTPSINRFTMYCKCSKCKTGYSAVALVYKMSEYKKDLHIMLG